MLSESKWCLSLCLECYIGFIRFERERSRVGSDKGRGKGKNLQIKSSLNKGLPRCSPRHCLQLPPSLHGYWNLTVTQIYLFNDNQPGDWWSTSIAWNILRQGLPLFHLRISHKWTLEPMLTNILGGRNLLGRQSSLITIVPPFKWRVWIFKIKTETQTDT